MIENEAFTVRAGGIDDGSLESIEDRRTGIELLAGAGNELVIQEEYPTHPRWGEGPWLLCQKGRWRGPADRHAKVRAERCPIGSRLVTEYAFDELQITQETLLWDGSDVIEFRTHVDGSIGHDRLLRVRFATNVPGGLPIYQTGLSVIGRPFGDAEIDVAEHTYTLDNPAHEWFGVGSTARICLTGQAGERRLHAIGVAEVVAPADAATDGFAPRDTGAGSDCRDEVRALLVALAGQGVTATCSVPEGPRYGAAELDSNLPDIRIALGGPDKNDFTAQVLAAAGPAVVDRFETQMAETGSARIWVPAARGRRDAFVPGADLRGSSDLPVLIVAGTDLRAAIAAVTDDLADAQIEAPWSDYSWSDEPGLANHAVALLNRGLPGSLVTPAGDACISLMRACSAWPSGTWMDGEKRTVPDGSSFAWQHWSHTFEYALASGSGDWRTAGFPVSGQEYSHRLLTCETDLHGGPLPAAMSLLSVTPAGVDVMAMKPRGNPIAPLAQPDPADGVTLRLRDVAGRNGRTTAAVHLFTGASAATVTSLLEDGERLRADDGGGAVTVVVPERGTVTLAITPGPDHVSGECGGATRGGAARTCAAGIHQVLAARQGTGAGRQPAGRRSRVPWQAGGPARRGRQDQGHASRVVRSRRPAPSCSTSRRRSPSSRPRGQGRPAARARRARKPSLASCHSGWRVAAMPRGTFLCGFLPLRSLARHFIAARLIDDAGQLLEDVAVLAVGEPEPPAATTPLDQLLPALERISLAEAAEAELTMVTGHLELPPGGSGTVTVRLSNTTASEIRGEAQLISPHGSWSAHRAWTTGFATDPGSEAELSFGVAIPRDARPGQRWWALVKVMYFGRLRYSEPIWITVTADPGTR